MAQWHQGHKRVTVTATERGFEIPTRRNEMFYIFHFFALVLKQSMALSYVPQYAMPPEFGSNYKAECLSTKLPLPTLYIIHTGYSVKLKKK